MEEETQEEAEERVKEDAEYWKNHVCHEFCPTHHRPEYHQVWGEKKAPARAKVKDGVPAYTLQESALRNVRERLSAQGNTDRKPLCLYNTARPSLFFTNPGFFLLEEQDKTKIVGNLIMHWVKDPDRAHDMGEDDFEGHSFEFISHDGEVVPHEILQVSDEEMHNSGYAPDCYWDPPATWFLTVSISAHHIGEHFRIGVRFKADKSEGVHHWTIAELVEEAKLAGKVGVCEEELSRVCEYDECPGGTWDAECMRLADCRINCKGVCHKACWEKFRFKAANFSYMPFRPLCKQCVTYARNSGEWYFPPRKTQDGEPAKTETKTEATEPAKTETKTEANEEVKTETKTEATAPAKTETKTALLGEEETKETKAKEEEGIRKARQEAQNYRTRIEGLLKKLPAEGAKLKAEIIRVLLEWTEEQEKAKKGGAYPTAFVKSLEDLKWPVIGGWEQKSAYGKVLAEETVWVGPENFLRDGSLDKKTLSAEVRANPKVMSCLTGLTLLPEFISEKRVC